ncbi:hypothetical protein JOC75_002008 [Metabacillus crassostreae]|uniref:DUF1360 domain-containing protein n=1 Tax=Metabacillus crassostreae TaxID=929098 RepID=UPI00195BB75D|nr:DUF1360 domain-containing protein [Metabacillus crassostreae]MBM7604035.1 hypothetical protein [Metabacillus crassostreae]
MVTGFQFILFGFATFRLTRLIVFDQITLFLRKPFHDEIEEVNEEGEVETYIEIKGTGLKAWIGELLSCYWCTGVWCSAFLYGLWMVWPQGTEILIMILAIAGFAGLIESLTKKLID